MTPGFATYSMHGLLVRSDLALDELTVDNDTFDIEVSWGASRDVPNDPPPGEPVVRLASDERIWYSAVRNAEGYLLRFPGLCDFVMSPDCASIVCHSNIGVDSELIPILVKGTVVSFVLSLRGHHVLHASAVEVDGKAIAFTGASGMGKSTCAALLCAIGGRLVSDDVLRLQLAPVRCFRGASAIRIRPAAATILDLFDVRPKVKETADGRLAVSPWPSHDQPLLGAIVVPYPRRDISSVEIERVNGSEAFWMMTQFGRLVGWEQEAMVRMQFALVGDLVGEVPIVKAHIPWGPPFLGRTAEDLLAALELAID